MIDSHSHIYMERYDDDRGAVIARAVAAGVTQLLQVGCDLESSRAVVALSRRVPGIYAAVGVHPHQASTLDDNTVDALATLFAHPKVVAWGEIGLDFYYDNSPRHRQLTAFETQMEGASRLDVPVVIHTREAEAETLDVLHRYPLRRGGHVHCFTGTAGMAEQLIAMGFHIGFTGIVGFSRADNVRAALRVVPLERLLIETDSPYLAPQPHRGQRNEPAFVGYVAEAIAAVKSVPVSDILQHTTQNFYQLYGQAGMRWESLTPPEAGTAV